MMKVLVTGGAGFIGRWVVKYLLGRECDVWVLDNLSSGRKDNIFEFEKDPRFNFVEGDILQRGLVEELFELDFDVCLHLAAAINVQESLINPEECFEVNVRGTFNILEEARKKDTKVVLISTCMVYKKARDGKPIDEDHPVCPLSPYAATKLAAENLALSYYHGYGLPVAILRPFNTYGPFQRTDSEGGVISIFILRTLKGEVLKVYGRGTQTRDFLYVEDCAEAIVRTALSSRVWGEIINIGTGRDISINHLAELIAEDSRKIKHVPHIHPQSEIPKLICDHSKAKRLLNWKPATSLREGIERTKEWINRSGEAYLTKTTNYRIY